MKHNINSINITIGKHFSTRFKERFDKQNSILNLAEYLNKFLLEGIELTTPHEKRIYFPQSGILIPLGNRINNLPGFFAITFKYHTYFNQYNTKQKQVKVVWSEE